MSDQKNVSQDSSLELTVVREEDESDRQALARHILNPAAQAAQSVRYIARKNYGETGLNELVERLEGLVEEKSKGDIRSLEDTLAAQLHTLDLLFNRLTQQSVQNMGSYTESAMAYMKLALRAQAQTRRTAESLAEMKQPRMSIRQTNIAHGHQQINNKGETEKTAKRTNGPRT